MCCKQQRSVPAELCVASSCCWWRMECAKYIVYRIHQRSDELFFGKLNETRHLWLSRQTNSLPHPRVPRVYVRREISRELSKQIARTHEMPSRQVRHSLGQKDFRQSIAKVKRSLWKAVKSGINLTHVRHPICNTYRSQIASGIASG